ncbi:MAG: Adaptive-response sensory-kinase SasA [Bacteroidia bacterium]|nr:Adaptive-response sensory-kinase SasA [Bacteroidia bacterium]
MKDFKHKDQELIYQILFESAGEGLLVANKEGTILMSNPRVCEMFGYTKEELLGKGIDILVPDQLRHQHTKHRESYHRHPKKRSMGKGVDLQGQRKDGSTFPVEISLNYFKNDDDMLVMALLTDISERKKSEQELAQTLREFKDYKFALDEAAIVAITDQKGIIKHANDNFCKISKYSREELIGQDHRIVNSGYHSKEFIRNLWTTIANGKIWKGELRNRAKDGTFYWVDTTIIPFLNEEGKPYQYVAIRADITERKQMNEKVLQLNNELEQRVEERTEALRESEKLYSTIARNYPNGTISVFDENLHYIFVEGKELFKIGVTSKDLIGTSYLDRLPKDISKNIEQHLRNVFKGVSTSFEFEYRNNHYLLNAVPMPDARGRVRQILVVEQNVTKQKNAENEIRKSLEKEKELNELKSRFVSMASHEFRTPLSTILSSVSLVQKYDGPENEEKREKHITRIKSAVNNLTGILNDFLSLDKLETGKVENNPVEFDIVKFAEEMTEEMQAVAKKGQQIIYKHKGKKTTVIADKHILKNILHNLLSNASKYSNEDTEINFNTISDKTNLKIEVCDKGIGIPVEEQQHMFERFFRAKNATNIGGTGLGLNIVKKYTELLDGKIEFESKSGEGTIFTIEIPMNAKQN